ncbi:ABC transporter permease [Alkaliphilus serpentinus]|uniref:ABC transporter permease n=1 Tax=Alkaliphilus serpentinus TaxID=1482731 RepID=A0A833HQX0_9FIRM|nr:ABC transporter permease [Alkaliphilus serpentinus]KAB3532403.1 ABC transporter permease [Alkaliphilus serpentinus]
MNKHVSIVFKKEIKDLFRDKRTWIASVLIPVLVLPLMFYLMGMGQNKLEKSLQEDINISIISQQQSDIADYLKGAEGVEVIEAEDPFAALQAGEIKVIVEIEEDFQQKLAKETPAGIKLIYDEISNESTYSVSNVEGVIYQYSEAVRNQRLEKLGIRPEVLQPTVVSREAYVVEGKESQGGPTLMIVTFLLPFLLMMYPVVGGMPAAIDLGAGEKERMSLEPLLSTGASRLSILTGKYLTILLTSVIGVLTSITGFFVASRISPNALPMDIRISPLSLVILIGVSLSIAMIVSGVMLAISVFAKSYKEAGTYLSPLMIFLMAPAYLTMFMEIRTVSTNLFFIPLLNSILLMKEALVDIINPLHIVITFGVSILLVIAALFFAKYMFNKESAIFRS